MATPNSIKNPDGYLEDCHGNNKRRDRKPKSGQQLFHEFDCDIIINSPNMTEKT